MSVCKNKVETKTFHFFQMSIIRSGESSGILTGKDEIHMTISQKIKTVHANRNVLRDTVNTVSIVY